MFYHFKRANFVVPIAGVVLCHNFCQNGGTCMDLGTAAFCTCLSGFSGLKCEIQDGKISTLFPASFHKYLTGSSHRDGVSKWVSEGTPKEQKRDLMLS